MSESAITISNLTKRFEDITAVDNLTLEIKWGELFGILGPNGAGKSTTVNILNTLLEPTDGSATVDGRDVVPLVPPRVVNAVHWRAAKDLAVRAFLVRAAHPWQLGLAASGLARGRRRVRADDIVLDGRPSDVAATQAVELVDAVLDSIVQAVAIDGRAI